jgi:uracil phosphoribosyltransferase
MLFKKIFFQVLVCITAVSCQGHEAIIDNASILNITEPQGSVIILDGTSTAGKTSIAKNLVDMLDESYEYIALDDFVTEVFMEQEKQHFPHKELLRRHFRRTGDMYDEIIKFVGQGKNVIVDTVFSGQEGEKDIRQGLEKLKDLNVFMALAYCPLPVLADRINSRNEKALSENRAEDMRSMVVAVKFDDIYRTKEPDDVVVGFISPEDIELAYEPPKGASSEEVNKFAKAKANLLKYFGKKSIPITPKLEYDCIVDTNKLDPQECALQIYECLKTSSKLAFEDNRTKLFKRSILYRKGENSVLLTNLRDKETSLSDLRKATGVLATLLAHEASNQLEKEEITIETPLSCCTFGCRIKNNVVLVPILKGGLTLLPSFMNFFKDGETKIGFIGAKRVGEEAQAVIYYDDLPQISEFDDIIIMESVIATGGNACRTIETIKNAGGCEDKITLVAFISVEQGLNRIQREFPQIKIITAQIDEGLDDEKCLIPGVGRDFGARFFGNSWINREAS